MVRKGFIFLVLFAFLFGGVVTPDCVMYLMNSLVGNGNEIDDVNTEKAIEGENEIGIFFFLKKLKK